MTKTIQGIRKITNEGALKKAREKSMKLNKEELLSQEIKKTEALRSQFLSNVSHELKTPINSILSATNLLQKKNLDAESNELLGIIHQSGQRLNITLNNVLDYYKLRSDLLTLDNYRFDIFTTIKGLYSMFEEEAATKGLNLDFEISSSLPRYVGGDESRLRQILYNILENAVKFTEDGTVKLLAGLDSKDGIFDKLFFRISDTGHGINSQEAENIWDAFSVGNKPFSREHQGMGMGLILSKKLAELMDGDVCVKETSAEGTTFEVHVSLKSYDNDRIANRKQNSRKILLVEDNLINQRLTQHLLSNNGFEVDVAKNGLEAVGKYKQRNYDIILMDIQMPVMDGITASKEIRMLESGSKQRSRVKIIALTANAQRQDKDECLAAGMDGYMSKPLNPKEIPSIFANL